MEWGGDYIYGCLVGIVIDVFYVLIYLIIIVRWIIILFYKRVYNGYGVI